MQLEMNAKKISAIKDFKLLSTPGIIGAYKECELTHIFLIETKTKKLFHYYALLSYEEFSEQSSKPKGNFLTPSPIEINNSYKLGIKQSRVSFDQAKIIFYNLCLNNLSIDNQSFSISKLITILPKTHIPLMWETEYSLLHKILKPNFWGDCYILKFFSNQYPFEGILSDKDLIKINKEIKKYINIDLDSINDRIGSFIFQFPITLVKVNFHPMDDWCNGEISIKTYPPFGQNDNIMSIISTELDNVLTSCNIFEGVSNKNFIELGDSHNYELLVINKENKLIYHHFKGNFIRYCLIGGSIGIHNSEPRTFITSDNEEVKIDLLSNDLSAGISPNDNYDERIHKRIKHNEIIKLSNGFMIFNKQRKEALSKIRKIIQDNSNNSSEIWIMDPYLLSKDIIDTLYYNFIKGIKLKCITSYKKSRMLVDYHEKENKKYSKIKNILVCLFKKKRNSKNYYFNKYKLEQQEYLLTHSNNLNIILDFRATHDTTGFNFHDRFLFFIPADIEAIPIVYSLGTSINSLGTDHHIMQQVPDPRKLVYNFMELWKLLDNEASIIIKLPVEKKNGK